MSMKEEKKKVTRTALREIALRLLFGYTFNTENDGEALEDYYNAALQSVGYEDDPYVRTVFFGVVHDVQLLDGTISEYAVGWKLGRISRMSLSIMRLCLYEAEHIDDVPVAVAINEAVELAKKYDTEAAPAFINGILNAALKDKEKTE